LAGGVVYWQKEMTAKTEKRKSFRLQSKQLELNRRWSHDVCKKFNDLLLPF